MTTIMMLLVFASLGVNIAVGIYFLVLAKRDINASIYLVGVFLFYLLLRFSGKRCRRINRFTTGLLFPC